METSRKIHQEDKRAAHEKGYTDKTERCTKEEEKGGEKGNSVSLMKMSGCLTHEGVEDGGRRMW